jgi:hypothetical protein
MRLYHIAAATLLIGTSAFAYNGVTTQEAPFAAQASKADNSAQMKKAVRDVLAESKTPKLVVAADRYWMAPEPDAGNPDLDLAVDPASVRDPAFESGASDTNYAGVGGPDLEAEAPAALIAAADTAPRPAAQNYPPCAPGPGDDNCIQLYEPGVRTALAAWTQPTGGLIEPGEAMASADAADDATGVGGPYEPVAGGTSETAMNGDGVVDPAVGELDDEA